MVKQQTISSYFNNGKLNIQKIIDEYYNYINTIIKNAITLSIEDEEELISDIFLIIWKNQHKLDGKLTFSPYIVGITKNIIYRKYNELNKSLPIVEYEEELMDSFSIDKIIEKNEFNYLINKQLKEMEQIECDIFTQFYYEGKKVKEIAEKLKLTTSNVKTKLYRIRKKMKKILKLGGF